MIRGSRTLSGCSVRSTRGTRALRVRRVPRPIRGVRPRPRAAAFDDVEGDPGTVARHRTPQQHVGERLGHLLAEGPDHLGPDQRRLDALYRGEGRKEVGIFFADLQDLGRPDAVELEEPVAEHVGYRARGLEPGHEGPEVRGLAPGQRDSCGTCSSAPSSPAS